MLFPMNWHQHQDFDDGAHEPNVSGGDHSFGLTTIDGAEVNVDGAALTLPDAAGWSRRRLPPHSVDSDRIPRMTIMSAWSSLALAAVFVAVVGMAAAAAAQSLDAPPDVGGVPADAEVTDSGLAYKVLQEGTGSRRPNRLSTVSVHYTGWLTNGTLFDSSVPTGRPATFPLNRVIGGWTEGVQMMVVGEKRRFWIPAELGYGDRGFQNLIPGGALLVFDIELVSIQ